MPELPEVETVRRGLEKALRGKVIKRVELRRKTLRLPIPADFVREVSGKTLVALKRRAKYLLLEMSGGKVILLHLGMSGSMVIKPKAPKDFAKHDHIVFYMDDGMVVVFNDPRRFGLALLLTKGQEDKHALLKHLGAEPLEKAFGGAYLKAVFAKRKQAIKTALMDQRLVVGVGNIYASEALFESGIHPLRAAGSLALGDLERLAKAVRSVLNAALASGGSTLRNYMQSDGELGYFQHRFKVYEKDEKPCVKCKTPIEKMTQGGRSTYFCATCQPRRKK